MNEEQMIRPQLIELHAHTSETSACAEVRAADVIRLYEQAGYQGVAITDHCHAQYFDSLGSRSWPEKVDCWLQGWRSAAEAGARCGLKVYLGMEYRNTETEDDFLIYGLRPGFLLKNQDIFQLPLARAFERFHEVGATIIQAHPVRMRLAIPLGETLYISFGQKAMLELLRHGTPVSQLPFSQQKEAFAHPQEMVFLRSCHLREPELLDGIEAFNGNTHWVQDPAEIQRILMWWFIYENPVLWNRRIRSISRYVL